MAGDTATDLRPGKLRLAPRAWLTIAWLVVSPPPLLIAQPSSEPAGTPGGAMSTMAATSGPEPILTAPAPRVGPGNEALAGSDVPTYKLLRYDEDYGYLKDPGRRSDLWDFIKYVPSPCREGW